MMKTAKNAHQVPGSALERTRCDRARLHASAQSQDRAHYARVQDSRSSACHISRISHVALAIASPTAPWKF
jgi:hypothetical protein